ncbi:hypothetical protein TNCV_4763561 [Trichonephila clavipes]|nr:hypothetical protein TNCV_4763561 [Trichonephila clavipes]
MSNSSFAVVRNYKHFGVIAAEGTLQMAVRFGFLPHPMILGKTSWRPVNRPPNSRFLLLNYERTCGVRENREMFLVPGKSSLYRKIRNIQVRYMEV